MKHTYRKIAVLSLAAALSACGGSGGSGQLGGGATGTGTFGVLDSTPASGALSVDLNASISVRFECPVDPASVSASAFAVWAAERVPGAVQVFGDTILFDPDDPLALFATHSVRLTTAIRATTGETLSGDLEIEFRTREGTWSAPDVLPTDATVADFAGTPGGELLALRLRPASPWSDLVVTHQSAPGALWISDPPLFADGSVTFARLALDGAGWAVAVANRAIGTNTYSTWAAERSGNGTWSAPVEAAPLDSGFTQPQLALVGEGRALLAWRRNATSEVWARVLDATTGWSSALRVSAQGAAADLPTLAADGQGNAVLAWRESSERLHAARYSAATGWSASELVHDGLVCCVLEPIAAIAPGAPPAIAWHADGSVFVSHFRPSTATWSGAEPASGAGCATDLERPRLALDPAQRTLVTWLCGDDLWAALAEPDEPFGAPMPLDQTGTVSDSVARLDANGNATLLWTNRPAAVTRLVCRRRAASGAWGDEILLSDPNRCAVAPRLVDLPSGALRAAWTVTVGCDFSQGTSARAAPFD